MTRGVSGSDRPGTPVVMAAAGHLELTLSPQPESVGHARAEVLRAVPDLGGDLRHTMRLLISELVTNALRHGDGEEPVELRARWDGKVRVEVVDHGDGFAPMPRSRPLEEPGGYGLVLVGSLADRWGVETDHCTTVWFELEPT